MEDVLNFPGLSAAAFLIAAFLGGACAFWVVGKVGSRSVGAYRRRFVVEIGNELRQNFVAADPGFLFLLSTAAALGFSILGWVTAGPVLAVAGGVAGLLAPRIALLLIRRRRTDRFIHQLPDALHSLASTLRAGANLTRGLGYMATQQPAPLSQEFGLIVARCRAGCDLGEALAELRRRIPRQEIDLLSSAINISRRVGGNLADTLESLADTLREKEQMESKIKALTAMGRMQGWVVGLLPLGVGLALYAMQPRQMSLLFTESYGWAVLAVVAAMMALAAWMIRKIVDIDV